MSDKSYGQMTFNEKVDYMTWYAIQEIVRGTPLRSVIFQILNIHTASK